MFILEVGHLIQSVRVCDINDTISVPHRDDLLHYSLIGFTICTGIHFYMRVKYNGLWYSYDGMERPKLNKLEDKEVNFIGRVNNIIYFLTKITKKNS